MSSYPPPPISGDLFFQTNRWSPSSGQKSPRFFPFVVDEGHGTSRWSMQLSLWDVRGLRHCFGKAPGVSNFPHAGAGEGSSPQKDGSPTFSLKIASLSPIKHNHDNFSPSRRNTISSFLHWIRSTQFLLPPSPSKMNRRVPPLLFPFVVDLGLARNHIQGLLFPRGGSESSGPLLSLPFGGKSPSSPFPPPVYEGVF